MIRLPVHEAKTHLPRDLERLEAGEVIVRCRRNVAIAEIRPLRARRSEPRPVGLARGWFVIRTVVLDSSVLLQWFRQGEERADQALGLRASFLEGELEVAVPWLAVNGVANVLRFKNDLSSVQVQGAVKALLDMGLSWVAPTPALMRRAVALAHDADITVYDSTFAALAEGLDATFVTADTRLVERLGDSGRARLLEPL